MKPICTMTRPRPHRQHGVALAVSLILLVVIGLSSVTAIQSGMFGSMIANNTRTNQLAVQAAEMALRFCERGVQQDPPAVPIQPLPAINTDAPVGWNDINNWQGGGQLALDLPGAIVNSANSDVTYGRVPQCLVEQMELRPMAGAIDEVAFLITARGFSPDYVANGNQLVAGSEVWLQSTIRWTP